MLENRRHPVHATGAKNIDSVERFAGCVPVMLPALGDRLDVESFVERIDGLVLTGGRANVEPHHYDGPPFSRRRADRPRARCDRAGDGAGLRLGASAGVRDLPWHPGNERRPRRFVALPAAHARGHGRPPDAAARRRDGRGDLQVAPSGAAHQGRPVRAARGRFRGGWSTPCTARESTSWPTRWRSRRSPPTASSRACGYATTARSPSASSGTRNGSRRSTSSRGSCSRSSVGRRVRGFGLGARWPSIGAGSRRVRIPSSQRRAG